MGYLNMSLLQIYQWVCLWKNLDNQLTFGEVMGKSLMSCFFDSLCTNRSRGPKSKSCTVKSSVSRRLAVRLFQTKFLEQQINLWLPSSVLHATNSWRHLVDPGWRLACAEIRRVAAFCSMVAWWGSKLILYNTCAFPVKHCVHAALEQLSAWAGI